MVSKTQKWIIGFLTLVILASGAIYIMLPGQVKLQVDNDKSTFYVYDNSWVKSGVEYSKLFDGNKLSGIINTTIKQEINGSEVKIIRTKNFNNGTIIDTYIFNGNLNDKEKFPVNHSIEIINAKDFIFQYEVSGLYPAGNILGNITSPQFFGKSMQIEWQDGYYYSVLSNVSGKYKLIVKYKIDSDYKKINVRLFDPDVSTCSTLTGGVYTLVADLQCANDGIVIDGNNIDFNCNGHFINYSISGASNDRGIETAGGHTNNTIRNCDVRMANITSALDYRQGIVIYNTLGVKIYNTSVNMQGTAGYYWGIEMWGSSGTHGSLNLSSVIVNNPSGDGIAFADYSINSTLENSNITALGWGVDTWTGTNNFIIRNNRINVTSTGWGMGVYLQGTVSGTNITGNTIYAGLDDIYVLNTLVTKTYVKNNQFLSSTNNGIFMNASGIFEDNIISGAAQYGMWVQQNNVNITNMSISSADNSFVFYIGAGKVRVINSSLSSSAADNVYVRDATHNYYFDRVVFSTASGNNLYFTGASSNFTVINSNFSSATDKAIDHTSGGVGLNLTNNIVTTPTGFYLPNVNRSFIMDNNITTTMNAVAVGDGNGIYLPGSFNIVNDNNITTSGSSGYGISLVSTSLNNNFSNNVIRTSGASAFAFSISGSDNNLVNNLNVTTTGDSAYGILVTTPDQINMATGNVFTNSTSLTGGSATEANLACALYVLANNNNFTNMNLTTTGGNGTIGYAKGAPGLLVRNSSNNYFTDITMNAVNAADIMSRGEASYTSYFINVTYNEIVFTGTVSQQKQYLDFSWYAEAQVRNSTSNLQGVNVTIYNVSNVAIFSQLTNSSGRINKTIIKAFIINGTLTQSMTPHNFTANLSGYKMNSSVYNLTAVRNVFWNVSLSGYPSVDYSVAVPIGVLRFLNCSPDFENKDSRPSGQTAVIGVINATNNGTGIGNFLINLTGVLNTGWTIYASNDSLVHNLTLSTTAQNIWSNVGIGETKKIWLKANCSFVSSNPGKSINILTE